MLLAVQGREVLSLQMKSLSRRVVCLTCCDASTVLRQLRLTEQKQDDGLPESLCCLRSRNLRVHLTVQLAKHAQQGFDKGHGAP